MTKLNLFSKAALFLILISFSTVAIAWGWGLSSDTDMLPMAGETRGDVSWVAYDVGTGPCASYEPYPDPLPPISIPPTFASVQTVTTSQGILRPLGRVIVETAHCAEGMFALDGIVTVYAAGGTLEGSYVAETQFVVPEPEPPLFLPAVGGLVVQETVYEITGGTGRFENASGRLTAHVFVTVGDYGYAADITWSIHQAIAGYIQFPE
jgi:hypothetical protein